MSFRLPTAAIATMGFLRRLFAIALLCSSLVVLATPARAGAVDRDVKRYLVSEGPAAVKLDDSGNTREFTGEALTRGRELFMENCAYCHSNGLTLPFPPVSLTLEDLAGATPPRDNISGFVEYMRFPMTYDGSEPTVWCREVPESWLSREELEELAAFTLSAADKVPGWGTVPSRF
ncbi:Photosystem II protein PsbV cytochrome c550 [Geitlerinema sp. FC II]|nr:photosystem II cytochrome PsbV2 [Geitlerinema sp. CS-897]PPT07087.1 Photosystem II protein PsbV cytochrome c550 [Geitlerinema sp. FC II]